MRVTVLGATGSIGQNTVDLLRTRPDCEVVAITGAQNISLLAEQARALNADLAVTAVPENYAELRGMLEGSGIEAAAGPDALIEAAARPADWTMSAIVGAAGLAPGLKAAEQGGRLALANKESLVCAGSLLQRICAAHGTELLPVDSEHSAIFQCLQGEEMRQVERIILTASGGPFRRLRREEMRDVTPDQAVAHPNWSMGRRISIDSASMFNKAMELIEAKYLFDVTPEMLEVVIHSQSIIHSMVGFADGAIMAQLGPSDMRGAIGYALNYPDRAPLPVERLDFAALGRMDFEPEDRKRFPALQLARDVMAAGGLSGAIFNAAKEVALDAFLAQKIGFLDMSDMVTHVMDDLGSEAASAEGGGLADVLEFDTRARRVAEDWAKAHA